MQDQKEAEIEVTDEMAEVGGEIVSGYDGKFVTAREVATQSYRAMELVRRRCAASGDRPEGA